MGRISSKYTGVELIVKRIWHSCIQSAKRGMQIRYLMTARRIAPSYT